MTKSRSIDQSKLKILGDNLCDNLEKLLDNFGIEYKANSKMLSMKCPIHGGDNPSAVNIYPEGENYRGNWKCRTHNCESHFKSSVIGFVRGIISNQKYNWEKPGDSCCSFEEAIDYIQKFLKQDLSSIKISKKEKEKNSFSVTIGHLNQKIEKSSSKITRDQIVRTIQIPAQYYVDRKYSTEVLTKYDVGLCTNSIKPMFNRVVVPIYDNEYRYMVGCTARSIFEKCERCKSFHHSEENCPDKEDTWKHPKWKHSLDFKSQNYLYNYWFAKDYILKSATAVIVESPGNVWRLEENGIHNSVAIFGSSLSDKQKILLDSSGAMNLVLLMDNDEAGIKAAQQIKQKCQNTYRIFIPQISQNDVGDMNSDEIDKEIKNILESIM